MGGILYFCAMSMSVRGKNRMCLLAALVSNFLVPTYINALWFESKLKCTQTHVYTCAHLCVHGLNKYAFH